jgi:truncated hemoglobin YjbI
MGARALLVVVLFGGLGLVAGRADDPKKLDPKDKGKPDLKQPEKADPTKPLDRVELDRRIAKIAFDASDAGTKLYNAGKPEECFRLYQGTLMALVPLLDHHPKLAAMVRERLDKAASMDARNGSFTLREALDAVQKETLEATMPPKKALYERVGGEKVLRLVVHDFVAAALADKKLDLTRGGKYKFDPKTVEQIEQVLVDILVENTGGPAKPTLPNLRAYLPGTNITQQEFAALVVHFYDALKKNNVPDDEIKELLALARGMQPYVVGQ